MKSERKIFRTKNVPVEFHEISIVSSGITLFPKIHWHKSLEILFFKEGVCENLIDDKIIQENSGDIVIFNAESLHCTKPVSSYAKYYCLIIDPNICNQFNFTVSEYYLKTEINDMRLFSLIEEIQNEFTNKNDHYEAAITAKVLEILTILFRDYSSRKKNLNPKHNKNIEMIKNGIRYIKDNYTQNISIDDVAQSTGYSKYYFCHCFKEITKYTVNSYINRLRVDMAYKLISEKGYSVSDAAVECGFDDISYFTKIFKKYTSKLPSHVKKKENIDSI